MILIVLVSCAGIWFATFVSGHLEWCVFTIEAYSKNTLLLKILLLLVIVRLLVDTYSKNTLSKMHNVNISMRYLVSSPPVVFDINFFKNLIREKQVNISFSLTLKKKVFYRQFGTPIPTGFFIFFIFF